MNQLKAPQLRLQIKVSLTFISFLFGCFGFGIFTWYDNFYAASTCFLLGLISYPLFKLNYAVINGKFREKYNPTWMWSLLITAIFVGVASFALTVLFASLAISLEQGFRMGKDGFYVASIPCLLSLMWSIVLVLDAIAEIKNFQEPEWTRMERF